MNERRPGVGAGVLIEMWSDVVCPWCYVGKRNLEMALDRFEHRDEVTVRFRSFELDPDAPRRRDGSYVARLARKYRTTEAEAAAMVGRMAAGGAEAGIDFRFDLVQPGNTFDAHRLLHLAEVDGLQAVLAARLLDAYFTRGVAVGEPEALAAEAVAAGLDPAAVGRVLDSTQYSEAVRADEARAADIGVTGVPFFLVGGDRGVAGAQRPEVLLRVIERAWAERHEGEQQS